MSKKTLKRDIDRIRRHTSTSRAMVGMFRRGDNIRVKGGL